MERSISYSARMAPAATPLDPDIQATIDAVMRGNPPLRLFTTLARDRRVFTKFFAAGLLDRGHLTLRQREIVIDRTTANCHAEYEWGVHVTTFAASAALTAEQLSSITHGSASDECWATEERVLIELCDQLHETSTIDDELWEHLRGVYDEAAILELLLLIGFYHTTSFIVNGLKLPLEDGAARFSEI
ncbi:MAG: carboxymuconolactone decarboxylase family protein [Marmoricola sp.]